MAQDVTTVQFHPDQYNDFDNLAQAFFKNADNNPNQIAYDQGIALDDLSLPREYKATTRAETKERVLKIADYLMDIGVAKGDSVMIIAASRPEWSEMEMGVFTCGGAVINAYVRDTADVIGFKLDDTKSRVVVVENQEQLEKLAYLKEHGCSVPVIEDREAHDVDIDFDKIIAIEEVDVPECLTGKVETLQSILERDAARSLEDFPLNEVGKDDMANVIYTSGSSGPAKGVPLTHGANLANIRQLASCGYVRYDEIAPEDGSPPTVTFLIPERGHAYMARMDQLAATSPVKSRFPAVADKKSNQMTPEAREQMKKDLIEGAEGLVPVVPKILMRMQSDVEKGMAGRGFKNWLARKVTSIGQKYYLEIAKKGNASFFTRAAFALTTPIRTQVGDMVKDKLVGPKFQFFGSGGAKLPADTNAFFWSLGMPILEGYGSTETNCPITMNTPKFAKVGTAGQIISSDIEYRIDSSNSELQVRGPNIAKGYLNRPQATAEAWTEDGWYKTNDKAHFDENGYLIIEERIDNVLVLENGENVAAFSIEEKMLTSPLLQEAIVYGHGKPGIVALVCVDYGAAKRIMKEKGMDTDGDLSQSADLKALIAEEIKSRVNGASDTRIFERVRHFDIIPALTVEDGTMTSTQKVQRKKVAQVHESRLEELYAQRKQWMK